MMKRRPPAGWLTLPLLLGLVLSLTWASQRSTTQYSLLFLFPIALGAMAVGLAFSVSRVPALPAHAVAMALGVVLIYHGVEPILRPWYDQPGWRPAAGFLIARATTWWGALEKGHYNPDIILYIVGVTTVLWVTAYGATWLTIRSRRPRAALLLLAAVLFGTVASARHQEAKPVLAFLVFALLLLIQLQYHVVTTRWDGRNTRFPSRLGGRMLVVGSALAALTILVVVSVPATMIGRSPAVSTETANTPGAPQPSVAASAVPSPSTSSGTHAPLPGYLSGNNAFTMGGPLNLSQDPAVLLQADQPYRLALRTYDTYDGHSWSEGGGQFDYATGARSVASGVSLRAGATLPVEVATASEQRDLGIQLLSSRHEQIFTSGQFVASNRDAVVQVAQTDEGNRTIGLDGSVSIPLELEPLVGMLKQAGYEATALQNPQVNAAVAALQSRGLHVQPVVEAGKVTALKISGDYAVYEDTDMVSPSAPIPPNQEYDVTVQESTATAGQLGSAGTNYPVWVTRRYLQLPGTVTARTHQLALNLTAGKNQYDAARAIEAYVRGRITYQTNIGYPPADQDLVDYVLFDSPEGYCEYYSTAMVVLLRSIGIPAREVVGLTGGTFDAQRGGYLYRESGAHAWPEAYFPSYGWIGFEPTAGYAAPPTAAIGAVSSSGGGRTPFRIVGPAIAILVLSIAALLFSVRRRGSASATRYYQQMVRAGEILGVHLEPTTTPYAHAQLLASRLPEARQAIDTLTTLYVREQYGDARAAPQELQRAWRVVRRATFCRRLHVRSATEK